MPEQARKKLRHELGGAFLATRDKVQEELKLTEGQKQRLEKYLREVVPDAMGFLQKIEGLAAGERKNLEPTDGRHRRSWLRRLVLSSTPRSAAPAATGAAA